MKSHDRLISLSERIDDRFHELEAIDLRSEPASWDCGRQWSPSIYISGKKDPGLMDIPRDGIARVTYSVKRRNIDESNSDGQPRYGADIEISSLEPIDDDDDGDTKLSSGEVIRVIAGGKVMGCGFLHEFADRDRDNAGRFSGGSIASPDDIREAYAPKAKKAVAGLAAAGAVAAGVTGRGRSVLGKAAKSVLRGASRLAIRG